MNIKERISKMNVPVAAYFIIAVFVIMYFFPRENKYTYSYSESKPWHYGLLTAPFSFHIQKDQNEIDSERDSILNTFQPYFESNDTDAKKGLVQFQNDAKANSVSSQCINYITRKLEEVYKAGVITGEDYEKILSTGTKQIKLKNDKNVYANRHINSFYSPKQVYSKLIEDKPSSIPIAQLQALNINNYLYPNVIFDDKTAKNVTNELLSEIDFYQGMIQSGEKIIDRGEIVDVRTKTILDSYTKEMEKRMGSKDTPGWLFVGQFLMISLLITSLLIYLYFYRIKEYRNSRSVLFILLLITVFAMITGLAVSYKYYNFIYIIPFTLPTILIRTFIDSRTAMTTHTLLILLCSLMVPQPAEFIIIQILAGFVCVFSLRKLSERSQLVFSAILILATYIVAYVSFVLCTEGEIDQVNWRNCFFFCINFVFITFAYLLVYIFEKIFGFISEVSMIELSNVNKPLLQQLSEVAPGTFQHSMQVSNLVVSAANRIGANAPLVRTGALYHDIGKMINPAFFTENQSSGMNPHLGLSEKESAKIIIDHVIEGVRIAKKAKLPQQIIDFIETHHGQGKVKYFYNTYVNNHPDEEVDIADFMYPGPNPFSKEMALLMMADTVEAASRSLKEYTKESISGLVNKLIDSQVEDGLLRNAPITFRDIEQTKEVFCEKLMMIYHTRISYPELNKKESKE